MSSVVRALSVQGFHHSGSLEPDGFVPGHCLAVYPHPILVKPAAKSSALFLTVLLMSESWAQVDKFDKATILPTPAPFSLFVSVLSSHSLSLKLDSKMKRSAEPRKQHYTSLPWLLCCPLLGLWGEKGSHFHS